MTNSDWRELELGSLTNGIAVDGDYTDSDTVATIEQEATDEATGDTVLTNFELSPAETRSVMKTLQDALEQNGERNVAGYPASLYGDTQLVDVTCPQCEEVLTLDERPTCPECGAQLEITVRVTGDGDRGPLPPE